MFAGHFAAAFIGKRVEPKLSLGTLALAAMLPDLLWPVFLLAGLEQVQYKAGMGAASYLSSWNVAFSHSLLMDAIWAGLVAAAYFLRRRCPRGAWVLFAAAMSNWLLDFVSNRDMPLAPGVYKYFGLALWKSIPATRVVEGGFWLLAIILYVRATRPKNRTGAHAFWIGVALLTLLWYRNIAGPPPPNPPSVPIFTLILFSLLVAWAYWMNRLRPGRQGPLQGGRRTAFSTHFSF